MNDKGVEFAVATKAVVYDQEGKYLILKKSSIEDINPNTYDLPGGRVEFGEKLEESVVREVKEETGFDIKPKKVFNAWTFVKNDMFQLTGIDFLSELVGGDLKLSDEHDSAIWMSLEEVVENDKLPDWLVKTIEKANRLLS